jgi:hypothetical protein
MVIKIVENKDQEVLKNEIDQRVEIYFINSASINDLKEDYLEGVLVSMDDHFVHLKHDDGRSEWIPTPRVIRIKHSKGSKGDRYLGNHDGQFNKDKSGNETVRS